MQTTGKDTANSLESLHVNEIKYDSVIEQWMTSTQGYFVHFDEQNFYLMMEFRN